MQLAHARPQRVPLLLRRRPLRRVVLAQLLSRRRGGVLPGAHLRLVPPLRLRGDPLAQVLLLALLLPMLAAASTTMGALLY